MTHWDSVEIWISDPWEWQTELGPGPHGAQIVEEGDGGTLLRLAVPVSFKNRRIEFLIAQPRHRNQGWDELARGQTVPTNFAFAEKTGKGWSAMAHTGVSLIGAMRRRDTL